MQPDRDDDRIHPTRDRWTHSEWAARAWYQPFNATLLKGEQPAVQRGRRAPDLGARSSDAKLGGPGGQLVSVAAPL